MSSKVVGDPQYRDADWESDPWTIEVRAWSLPEAVYKVANLPLSAWTPPQEDDPDADAEVLAAWKVLADRGLLKIEWQGLVPEAQVSAELLRIARETAVHMRSAS